MGGTSKMSKGNEQTDEELMKSMLEREKRLVQKEAMIKRWQDRQVEIMSTPMNEESRREFAGLTGSIIMNGGNQKW